MRSGLEPARGSSTSPVGVYGGFYAVRRSLVVPQPPGIILDDMFQPLSIIRQGYRVIVDTRAVVFDTWPTTTGGEFHRKVRTLAGNFQLMHLAPWTLSPQNRALFQLMSHKYMRLIVPYLLVLLLASTMALSGSSPVYSAFAALQMSCWAIAILGLGCRIPVLHRIAAPASALLVLNAAAVVGLYKFIFTRGPLWKIWNSHKTTETGPTRKLANSTPPEPAAAPVMEIRKSVYNDPRHRGEYPVVMNMKALIIFTLGILVGFGTALIGYGFHRHIDFAQKAEHLKVRAAEDLDKVFGARVRAAKLEHVVPPAPYFPPGSIWTQDVSHAPLDPNSSGMIATLADAGGWGFGRMQVDLSLRVLKADANTPYVPFRKGAGFYAADSDRTSIFPLPAGGGIEGGAGYRCNIDEGDCHLIVVDRDHSKLWEAYQANYADGALSANEVVIWDLNRVYPPSGRGDQCSSTDAAGFPIAPLVFNADELASGSINHAIRFTLPNPRIRAKVFVHPATHAGAPRGPASAPPMGAHFRLKASYDLSQLKPAARVIARAMQKYGLFLSDGGNITLTGQSDADTVAKYADVDFGVHDLQALKVTDFEVVDGGNPIPLTDDCVLNR